MRGAIRNNKKKKKKKNTGNHKVISVSIIEIHSICHSSRPSLKKKKKKKKKSSVAKITDQTCIHYLPIEQKFTQISHETYQMTICHRVA